MDTLAKPNSEKKQVSLSTRCSELEKEVAQLRKGMQMNRARLILSRERIIYFDKGCESFVIRSMPKVDSNRSFAV